MSPSKAPGRPSRTASSHASSASAARLAGVLDLPRALHRPEPVDQGRGVGERAAPGELRFHQAPVVRLEPEGIELHPEPGAPEPQLVEQRPQIAGGVHALGVLPDADVLDVRGMPRLAEIREPREQGHATVGLHDQALEQAEAEGVVAGEPVHGLLLEAEQRVEPGTADGRRGALAPSRHLFGAEMDRHVGRSSVQEGGDGSAQAVRVGPPRCTGGRGDAPAQRKGSQPAAPVPPRRRALALAAQRKGNQRSVPGPPRISGTSMRQCGGPVPPRASPRRGARRMVKPRRRGRAGSRSGRCGG